ncbi:MAG: hypothetical protein E7Z94_01965 [Actinomyces ruminicola]|nr:hypothetical protein [Actinomyces ruminicola]
MCVEGLWSLQQRSNRRSRRRRGVPNGRPPSRRCGGEMEGLHVDAATVADAEEYVVGDIGSDELVARVRARYVPC